MSGYKGDAFTERLAERARLREEALADQPPTLTLDEAGVERLAAAIADASANDHELLSIGTFNEIARAIIAALRGEG